MKFKLVINREADEEVVATVRERSTLTDQLEALVMAQSGTDRITAYTDTELRQLPFSDIACVTVIGGKTYAIDRAGKRYRLKQRLYELESCLPACFIRINKSALANENHLARFDAAFSGGVDAVFQCGYTEYVSRRCFAAIKRRYLA